MSDKIWLPGQTEDQPASDQLILPQGVSPRSDAQADEPAVSVPSPDPAAETPASETPASVSREAMEAQAERMQQFLQNLRYPPAPMQAECPQCSSQIQTLIFPVVDFGANPELLNMFLSGQLNSAMCHGCRQPLRMQMPVLVHLPEKEFLGVVVPEAPGQNVSPQAVIGDLASNFLTKIPPRERKGYMLAPKQFLSTERLVDALWEFQGVTREMRQRQAAQMELTARLLNLHADEEAMRAAVDASPELVDRNFVLQLMQMGMSTEAAPAEESQALQKVIETVLVHTPAGRQVRQLQQKVQGYLEQMAGGLDKAEQAQRLSQEWMQDGGPEIVRALVQSAPQFFEYEFLLELSMLIELEMDAARKSAMEEMRAQIDGLMKAMQNLQAQQRQSLYQRCVAVVQAALESSDPREVLRRHPNLLKGPLVSAIMEMMSQAQRNKASQVVASLMGLRQIAMQVHAESMGEEDRFLFRLIASGSVAEAREHMDAHRALITTSLLDKMKQLETELEENEMENQARKIKSLRGQMALMR